MDKKSQLKTLPFLFTLVLSVSILSSCVSDEQLANRDVINLNSNNEDTETPVVTEISRPTGAVSLTGDFCVCQAKKSLTLNNCDSTCSSKNDSTPTLYLNTTVGTSISLNEKLVDTYGWCNNEIDDGNTTPTCVIETTDGESNQTVTIDPSTNWRNNFSLKIPVASTSSAWPRDTVIKFRIKETTSGATSDYKQLMLLSSEYDGDEEFGQAPIQISPITRYYCLQRSGTIDNGTGDINFQYAIKQHYYFNIKDTTPTLGQINPYIFCHDTNTKPKLDNATYNRLGMQENAFMVWNSNDSYFYDLNSNKTEDVNDLIKEKLEEAGITVSSDALTIFVPFPWPTRPTQAGDSTEAGSSTSPVRTIGYVMQPWVDEDTKKAYCPTQADYYGSQTIFKVLREIVGVDTEGLYIAKRGSQEFVDEDGNPTQAPTDYLLIRESQLKSIWFHYDEGKHIEPTDDTVNDKAVYFYWPADTDYPYIQKSTQSIYSLQSPTELSGTDVSNQLVETYAPHDKRIACIPKTGT